MHAYVYGGVFVRVVSIKYPKQTSGSPTSKIEVPYIVT